MQKTLFSFLNMRTVPKMKNYILDVGTQFYGKDAGINDPAGWFLIISLLLYWSLELFKWTSPVLDFFIDEKKMVMNQRSPPLGVNCGWRHFSLGIPNEKYPPPPKGGPTNEEVHHTKDSSE